MKIIITINTDNSSFEDSLQWEVSSILNKLSARIASFQDLQFESDNEIRLLDSNGNTCGIMSIKDN